MRLAIIALCLVILGFVWFLQDQTGLPGHFYSLALGKQSTLAEAAKIEIGTSIEVPVSNVPPSDQAGGGGQLIRGQVWLELGGPGTGIWSPVPSTKK